MELSDSWYWLMAASVALAAVLFFLSRLGRKRDPLAELPRAQELFRQDRPRLETLFFRLASESGKPRGLRWKECQWEKPQEWVRDKQTGELLALVGITIAFEAIEGGDMEGIEAVGNLRNASAVFFFREGGWQTTGRAIFNLNPDEVLRHYHQGYERLS